MPQVKRTTIPNYVDKKLETHYKMNHKKRGVALIFNHKTFRNPKLSTRNGTEKDRDILKSVLINLGFEVEVKNEATYEEISNLIQATAKMDHSQNDCLVISVLTHGDLGILHANDTIYNLRKLWCSFTEQNCPTLAGKPKIFIIQACRGEKLDDGITLYTDGPSKKSETPTHPDFLLAYATQPDHYAWRNIRDGSWFVQSLCDILAAFGTEKHIMELLTMVCHKVAMNYESHNDDEDFNEKKEIPSINSTLTRLLVFKEKTKNNENTGCWNWTGFKKTLE